MSPFFTSEQIKQVNEDYGLLPKKYESLFLTFLSLQYSTSIAREHGQHGFCRRLQILTRCIHNIFSLVPLEKMEKPTRDELSDVNINLQAFMFNVYGCIENLAWIWVKEKGIQTRKNREIPPSLVGIRKKHQLVRGSFSDDFQEYLKGLDDWFNHLDNFRNAAAHRIPLYVPPSILSDDEAVEYKKLGDQIGEAMKRGEADEADRLSDKQDELGKFAPFMTHSFEENSKQVVFHFQVLSDFNTVDELGRKFIEEYQR